MDVVIALVKLENLKAIHNLLGNLFKYDVVVIALVKLENLKAIHNSVPILGELFKVVIALVKLENLKAIHNGRHFGKLSVPLRDLEKVMDYINVHFSKKGDSRSSRE